MKRFFNDFKDFAIKGNVMNLAIGVIIGAAFQNLVTSLTTNIISPLLGLLTGMNFDMLELNLLGVTIMYGAFITGVVNFIEMAFIVFLFVRLMNKLMSAGKKPAAAEEPTVKNCPFCMTDIHINATRCPSCTSQLNG